MYLMYLHPYTNNNLNDFGICCDVSIDLNDAFKSMAHN